MEWKDPPKGRQNEEWTAVITELQTRPGDWALLYENSASSHRALPLKARGCEVTSRKVGTSPEGPLFDIYVRWPANGDDS